MVTRLLITLLLLLPVGVAHAAQPDCYVLATPPTLPDKSSYPCSLDTSGNLRVVGDFGTITVSGADGATLDGVNPAIKATVLDLTNSNPITTAIVDASGNQITSFGGGTEVTEDAASAANPIGKMDMCRRRDTLTASEVSADSDVIAKNCTAKGEVYVKQTDPVTVTDGAGALNVIVDSGTTAATQSGTWTVQPGNTANTTPWLATINQGGNSATVNGSGQLAVNCANCSGSGVSQQDNTGFTPGTTNFVPMGGEVDDTGTTATAENSAGVARITAQRAVHMNLRNNSGTEIGTSGNPVRTDPTGTTTQPVSGTVSITTNSAVNVAQMNGVTTSMGVGASGTGTQRVASLIHDGTDTAQVTATSGGSLQVECTAGCSGSGGTSSNYGSAFPSAGTAAGFTDGTNMVAGRVVTSAPGSSDAGLVVRNINPNLAADNSSNSSNKTPVLPALAGSSAPTWTSGNQVPLSVDTSGALRVTGGTSATQYTEDAASAGAESMTLAGTIRQDTPAGSTSADGDYANLKTDSVGRLWVNGSGVTQPVSGTVTANAGTGTFNIQSNASVNLAQVGGSSVQAASNGLNTTGTGLQVSSLSGQCDDTTPTALTENSFGQLRMNCTDHSLKVDQQSIAGTTISTGNGVSGTGVQRVTIASDSTGQVALAAGSNTIGNVGALPVTSGGTSVCYLTSAATTNATNCKASAGQLYGYDLINTTTTIYYLRIYNASAAPTCSSATGFIRTIPIPPAAAAGGAGGIARSLAVGEAYGTGLGFCLTGGGSSTDNTNAATGVYVSLNYK